MNKIKKILYIINLFIYFLRRYSIIQGTTISCQAGSSRADMQIIQR